MVIDLIDLLKTKGPAIKFHHKINLSIISIIHYVRSN